MKMTTHIRRNTFWCWFYYISDISYLFWYWWENL